MYIVTLSHTEYIDFACRRIVNEMANHYSILNIDLSHFYATHSVITGGKDYINIVINENTPPRNTWQNILSREELRTELNNLWNVLGNIIKTYNIKAALIADDVGHFEKLFILFFNMHNIPVIHWVHGEEFTSLRDWYHPDEFPNNSKDNCIKNALTNVLPKGLNGLQHLCVNSQLDKIKLLYHGIMAQQIYVTGNPSLDYLSEIKRHSYKQKNSYKILYVSTGFLKFNQRNLASAAYTFLKNIIINLDKKYTIDIRLKPGENLKDLIDIYSFFTKIGIKITDNSIPIEEQMARYDAILLDKSSVCLKSVILGFPTIIMRVPAIERYIPLAHYESMKLLTVQNENEVNNIFQKALSEEYIDYQNQELKDNEFLLLHKNDGKSAMRIANFIQKIIETKSLFHCKNNILEGIPIIQHNCIKTKIYNKIRKILRRCYADYSH